MAGFVNRQVSVVKKQKTGALEGGVEKKQTVTHQREPSRLPRYRLPVVKLLEPHRKRLAIPSSKPSSRALADGRTNAAQGRKANATGDRRGFRFAGERVIPRCKGRKSVQAKRQRQEARSGCSRPYKTECFVGRAELRCVLVENDRERDILQQPFKMPLVAERVEERPVPYLVQDFHGDSPRD